jgi:outer membrane receptor protein involved in Fe transport
VFGGNRFQLANTDRRYEFTDNFTKIVGKHTLKTGLDINISHNSDSFTYGPKGEYRFADLTDVPSGNFELYLQSFGQSTIVQTSPTYSLFAQGQFRATPRLTLNYGVRYDLQGLPQPKQCNAAFDLTCHIPYSKNNVAPRAGFAYSIDSKGSTCGARLFRPVLYPGRLAGCVRSLRLERRDSSVPGSSGTGVRQLESARDLSQQH